jgi:hypothetical protein
MAPPGKGTSKGADLEAKVSGWYGVLLSPPRFLFECVEDVKAVKIEWCAA